jgi:hypothetical protein
MPSDERGSVTRAIWVTGWYGFSRRAMLLALIEPTFCVMSVDK